MAMITAPWTDSEVEKLNGYQNSGVFHPFTCAGDHDTTELVATNDGWICPSCDYTQNWAHDFMFRDYNLNDHLVSIFGHTNADF